MGFSVSGATAILFIGLLLAVGIAYPVIQSAHDQRATAIEDRDQRALDVRNTAISINQTVYDGDTESLDIEVINTGSTTLSVDRTDVLVDGVYQTEYTSAVNESGDRDLWQPGEVLDITVTVSEEPHRVKIVTQHGISDTTTEVS